MIDLLEHFVKTDRELDHAARPFDVETRQSRSDQVASENQLLLARHDWLQLFFDESEQKKYTKIYKSVVKFFAVVLIASEPSQFLLLRHRRDLSNSCMMPNRVSEREHIAVFVLQEAIVSRVKIEHLERREIVVLPLGQAWTARSFDEAIVQRDPVTFRQCCHQKPHAVDPQMYFFSRYNCVPKNEMIVKNRVKICTIEIKTFGKKIKINKYRKYGNFYPFATTSRRAFATKFGATGTAMSSTQVT